MVRWRAASPSVSCADRQRSDIGIDLHTGSDHRTNLPQIRGNLDDPRTRELARAFGAPLMLHAGLRDGSLRAAATDTGRRCCCMRAARPGASTRNASAGTSGTLRVLADLGMIELTTTPAKHPDREPQ